METPDKLPLILIVGPTAVGKSEVAIQLAGRLDGEIVSADSRLFYRGMDIGTAKPSLADRAGVPHHLIDIANPDEPLSLADFQNLALRAIREIHARGRLPFLVGGTGQYIRAVAQGWQPPAVHPDLRLRTVLQQVDGQLGSGWLHHSLALMDPAAAAKIDPSNLRRTIRALEVIFKTGRRFSEQRASGDSAFGLVSMALKRPRPELYARIDTRINAMFAAGFVDEVRALLERGYSPDLPSMSAIGYSQCVRVIRGQIDVDDAKAEIRRLTRVFVRRQANWFRESDPGIRWFDATDPLLIEKAESYIRQSIRRPALS